jgi:hypothetical protein
MPPVITSIGTPASSASAMPLAAWVSPAAGTMASVPTVPETRLTASAMKEALPSWVTSTGVIFSDLFSSS